MIRFSVDQDALLWTIAQAQNGLDAVLAVRVTVETPRSAAPAAAGAEIGGPDDAPADIPGSSILGDPGRIPAYGPQGPVVLPAGAVVCRGDGCRARGGTWYYSPKLGERECAACTDRSRA